MLHCATQALKGYTVDAAFAVFKENQLGTISKDKLADFTVLSKNILSVPPPEILTTRVVATVVGGRAVWVDPDVGATWVA